LVIISLTQLAQLITQLTILIVNRFILEPISGKKHLNISRNKRLIRLRLRSH